jgi:hypothetical protein
MTKAKLSSIFLSTSPQVEIPFAAEISLQIYDEELINKWSFAHVEVVTPKNSSYHWHPDYGNFRLRWLANTKSEITECVRLSWLHDNLDGDGLVLQLDCSVGDGRNSTVFSVSGMKFVTGQVPQPRTERPRVRSEFEAEIGESKVFGGTGDKPTHFIRAMLARKDIFGNEVYTLKLAVHEELKK